MFSELITKPNNLIETLLQKAIDMPDKPVFTCLDDRYTDKTVMNYSELDRKAKAIAVTLRAVGATGKRAVLFYPTGVDFITAFFGCLYSGVTAVPVFPAHPSRPKQFQQKVLPIIKDAQSTIILTNSFFLKDLQIACTRIPTAGIRHILATDRIDENLAGQWDYPDIDSETLAFIQYTSGSTASPKGVMLSHDNLMYNLSNIQQYFETDTNTIGVFWLPHYHDMGLIGGILGTIYCGGRSTLITPAAFLQKPLRWLQTISETRATISGAPNFAYELCCHKIDPAQCTGLKLDTWKLAFNGAEAIRAQTLDNFTRIFEPYGFSKAAFSPCYGLAEATLLVTGIRKTALPVTLLVNREALEENMVLPAKAADGITGECRQLVSCGNTRDKQRLAIVDPETHLELTAGQLGEIWLHGPCVSRGYWNKTQETEITFRAKCRNDGALPHLRTGDIGFILDGELYITGRLKEMIIIDGRNHYPQDIELSIEQSLPFMHQGSSAAFSVTEDEKELLVVLIELEYQYIRSLKAQPQAEFEQITRSVKQVIAEIHNIQVYAVGLLKLGQIPRTSSGKIKRYAARTAYLTGTLESVQE